MTAAYDDMDLDDMLTLDGLRVEFDRRGDGTFAAQARRGHHKFVGLGDTPTEALRNGLKYADNEERERRFELAHVNACALLDLLAEVDAPDDRGQALARLAVGVTLPDVIRWIRAELGDDTPVVTPDVFDPVRVGREYVNAVFPLADNQKSSDLFDGFRDLLGWLK